MPAVVVLTEGNNESFICRSLPTDKNQGLTLYIVAISALKRNNFPNTYHQGFHQVRQVFLLVLFLVRESIIDQSNSSSKIFN